MSAEFFRPYVRDPKFTSAAEREAEFGEKMREGMSPEELMEAWSQTGDERYLTPETMGRMGLVYNNAGEVESVGKSNEEIDEEILREVGVNTAILSDASTSPEKIVSALLPLVTRHVDINERHSNKRDFSEDHRYTARRILSERILHDPHEFIPILFRHLNPESLQSLDVLRYVESQYHHAREMLDSSDKTGYVDSSTKRLNEQRAEFIAAVQTAVESKHEDLWAQRDGLYFVFSAILDFIARVRLGTQEISADVFRVFKIDPNTYAARSLDENRLFLSEKGQVFRELPYEHQSRALHSDAELEADYSAWEMLIDSGALVTERYAHEFAESPNLFQDYSLLLHPRFKAIVEEDLRTPLNNLSIREQLHFLDYAKRIRWNEKDNLKYFASKYGVPGLRAFLAASVDPKIGNEILAFGRDADTADAEKVFAAFGHLSDTIESLEAYLLKTFGRAEGDIIREATERLLKRGRELLRDAHSYKDNPAELEHLLESLDTEQRILGDLVPLYIRRGYDLNDIVGIKAVSIPGGEIKGSIRDEINRMHRAGYEQNPDYSLEQVANLERDLNTRMDQSGTEFKIVMTQESEKPVAALRFDFEYDPVNQGKIARIFLASVMASDSVSGSRIGLLHTEAQIRAQLEAHGVPIHAICNPVTPITSKYLEMGFVINGTTKSSDGKIFFKIQIEKDPSGNQTLNEIKQTPERAIIDTIDRAARVPSGNIIYQKPASIDEIVNTLTQLQTQDARWCIARYFKSRNSAAEGREAKYYAVFARKE